MPFHDLQFTLATAVPTRGCWAPRQRQRRDITVTMVYSLTSVSIGKNRPIAPPTRARSDVHAGPLRGISRLCRHDGARGFVNNATEDGELIARIAKGDRSAMRLLFGRHQLRVHRFVCGMVRDASLAEDLVNEVFLEVWKQAGRFEGRSSVSTWLLGIARFKALSSRRRRSEAELDEEAADAIADDADTPEVVAQKNDKGQALRACINALPPEHKVVVDLVYYQEKTIEEAAGILSIPEATVKTRMFYARKKLADMMTAAGIDRGWP